MDEQPPQPAPPDQSRRLPLRLRLGLALMFWVMLAMMVLIMVSPDELTLRWGFSLVSGGPSFWLAWHAKMPPETPDTLPEVDKDVDRAAVALKALERSDRSQTAWLAIAGALHSAALTAAYNVGLQTALDFEHLSYTGLGLALLGAVSLVAGNAILTAGQQARRALEFAAAHPASGKLFEFVYRPKQVPWQQTILPTMLTVIAGFWLYLGALLLVLSFLRNVQVI